MSIVEHKTCLIGPAISAEQFVSEHVFFYMIKGQMTGYAGNKYYTLGDGDYCIGRKNQLARYRNMAQAEKCEKVILVYDEAFLKQFQQRHKIKLQKFSVTEPVIWPSENELIPKFIESLSTYYNNAGYFDQNFADVKREELLLILLRSQPEMTGLFFDYGMPGKMNLEEFMNRNYKFNVSIERFAFLTGRSVSAFKRDFKTVFNQAPHHWLMHKRLHEARLLIEQQSKKPSEIYVDLGFEDLSHFSFAFKKEFGHSPTEIRAKVLR